MSSLVHAFIDVQCDSEKDFGFDRIAMKLARFPEVSQVSVVSGKGDLVVIIEGKSVEEISLFVTDVLAPMEEVSSTATQFLMKTYKMNGKFLFAEKQYDRLAVAA